MVLRVDHVFALGKSFGTGGTGLEFVLIGLGLDMVRRRASVDTADFSFGVGGLKFVGVVGRDEGRDVGLGIPSDEEELLLGVNCMRDVLGDDVDAMARARWR